MNTTWNELIERILSGEVEMDHDEVREASRNPQFMKQLDESYAIIAALDEVQILKEIRSEGHQPSALDTHALVRDQFYAKGWKSWGWRGSVVTLLAAASVLFFVVPTLNRTDAPNPSQMLGSFTLEALSPRGSSADFSEFRWTSPGPGGSVLVEVFGPNNELLEGSCVEYMDDISYWRPGPEVHAKWGSAVRWRLTWRPPGGGTLEYVDQEVSA